MLLVLRYYYVLIYNMILHIYKTINHIYFYYLLLPHLTFTYSLKNKINTPVISFQREKNSTSISEYLLLPNCRKGEQTSCLLCVPHVTRIKETSEINETKIWCFKLQFCTVRLYWAGKTWANEVDVVVNHTPGAGSIAQPVDL